MTTKVRASVLADTAVTPEKYGGTQTLQTITVDAQGRITYAANITSGVVTADTTGQAADIIVPSIRFNALGQIVAATNNTIRLANTTVTGVVQLADSVSNTSTTAAATSNSVTNTYNHAGLAFNTANSASGVAASAFGQANLSFNTANSASGVAASAFGQANLAYSTANSAFNASNLSSGTVPSGRISGSYTGITGVGTLAAGSIPASLITGLYPVGSIYINASVATNPGTLLGFGTWTAFGAGRVMVGFNAGNALFDTAEETGGSADASVVSHTHTATVTDPGHVHGIGGSVAVPTNAAQAYFPGSGATPQSASAVTGISVSNSTEGSSGTNANYQPYITVYMWKRTA
jgi:hypothetical protein